MTQGFFVCLVFFVSDCVVFGKVLLTYIQVRGVALFQKPPYQMQKILRLVLGQTKICLRSDLIIFLKCCNYHIQLCCFRVRYPCNIKNLTRRGVWI